VENSLLEIPNGLIEASRAMGANAQQVIFKVLLPEALLASKQCDNYLDNTCWLLRNGWCCRCWWTWTDWLSVWLCRI
jgi:ABC-type arginine/histidine transport system permease subunit